MNTGDLSLDQAPPLSVPASFFVTVPAFVVLAGVAAVAAPSSLAVSRWMPHTLGFVHVLTLGALSMAMTGALLQMVPVLAGAPVRAARLGHAAHAGWVLAALALPAGLATGAPELAAVGLAGAALASAVTVALVGEALVRAPTRTPTVWGMRLAVASLAVVAVLGGRLALGYAGVGLPADRAAWTAVHAVAASMGWVGTLIAAVSWHIVPMFYVAPAPPRGVQLVSLAGLALGATLPPILLAAGTAEPAILAASALPAALVLWGLHPITTLVLLARRRRRRVDRSFRFWQLGLTCALACGPLALGAALGSDPRWSLALGWVALWGWALAIVHGMLCRIVPFLVWFHRFSAFVGLEPVPSMRDLLPDRWARAALWAHAVTLALGLAALAHPLAVQATGAGLVVTGALLGTNLTRVLRARRAT